MKDFLKSFFEKENIEFYSSVDISRADIICERKMPQGITTAVVFLVPYRKNEQKGNLSVYASSKDYHLFIRMLSARLKESWQESFPDSEIFCFSDNSPIDEVSLACDAGLGFVGENRLLINEKYGSFVFVGEILLRERVRVSSGNKTEKKTCLSCGKCRRACPSYLKDGGVCMSELTQKKNVTDSESELLRSHPLVFGCDICQEVCPHNANAAETPIGFFLGDRLPHVTADMIRSMSDSEFSERAYAWRGRKTILRNLLLK